MRLPETAIIERRQASVRDALDALDLDAVVITEPLNIRFLSNHVGSAGVLVLTRAEAHLLLDFRYEEAVRQLQESTAASPHLRTWRVPGSYDEALVGCLCELGLSAVGFEAAHISFARHQWLTRALASRAAGITLRSTTDLVEKIRIIKDAAEIGMLREAARRLAPVVEVAITAVREGVTERAVAATIEGALRDAGYERPAFDTIVASGPNSALPHYRAGDRVLARGDLVVLDFGGVLDGYCCDLTRTVAIGTPDPDARRIYAAVLEAQQAAIAAVRPGLETSSVDAAARGVLDARGLGDAFGHGTGHGLGLDVHEQPRITRPQSDVPAVLLEPGMVFTIEPGAYLPGWGGIRIEDDVLVTDSGCELLTTSARDLLTR